VKRESETENEGLREYVKVLERVGYECGQLVRERWKLIALKSAIAKKREKQEQRGRKRINWAIAAGCA